MKIVKNFTDVMNAFAVACDTPILASHYYCFDKPESAGKRENGQTATLAFNDMRIIVYDDSLRQLQDG